MIRAISRDNDDGNYEKNKLTMVAVTAVLAIMIMKLTDIMIIIMGVMLDDEDIYK